MSESILHSTLQQYFGYDSFRPLQEAAIQKVLDNEDVLLILPTGGGKSMCFQIPILVQEGYAVVVSPLIALMEDQILGLNELGIGAEAFHSNVRDTNLNEIFARIKSGKTKLLYMAPETLLQLNTQNYIRETPPKYFAIDEAHCVSIWGNDFRPEYVNLKRLKDQYPGLPMIATTATADSATRKDIIAQLNLGIEEEMLGSFERENLFLSAKPGQQRIQQIDAFLRDKTDESGIIYCTTRKETENVANKLVSLGYSASYYHAGLSAELRQKVFEDFIYDRVQIVCATIAFGMGIDKSNIRWIIHYNLPKNIEGYYQEIGRAGRDGANAEALLFYSYADVSRLTNFIENSEATEEFKTIQRAKLDQMMGFATSPVCRTNTILNYFGEFRDQPCDHCDNCLHPRATIDSTKLAQMALSAVYRLKQAVGVSMLIDVLRGSGKREIFQAGFQNIKTYGVGRHLSFFEWRDYVTQMIHKGLLYIDLTNNHRLKLTALANDVLFNGKKIELVEYQDQAYKKKESFKNTIAEEVQNIELFELLKDKRLELAREKSVPAYVVFSDAVLENLADYMPVTDGEFIKIQGIGPAKLQNYGDIFMTIIKKYREEHPEIKPLIIS